MLHSHRRRSVVALAAFLPLVGGLILPTTAGAADPVSSLAVTDPANDTVIRGTTEPPTDTPVEAPRADITAASARYQNDHITFTMKLRQGDDLSNPDSWLWWTLSNDEGGAIVSLRKGSDGLLHVVKTGPADVPVPSDTSLDCAGSGASLDVSLGTYIASFPASCVSPEPLTWFNWGAGREVPVGAGPDKAFDAAPDGFDADPVTNAPVFGYWNIGSDGRIYPFGDAIETGEPPASANLTMIDIEAAPHGTGYWTVDQKGIVSPFGVVHYGNATDLKANERVVSLSGTPTGAGYWIFTNKGRAIAFGDANKDLGDVSTLPLNGEVLDSSPTPSGKGYYLVAADGGVFALGDAKFEGSMGGKPLNGPVQSVVPDPDGRGYWLVATDGGVFAFQAPFKGSMGATPLNKPMTGMVPYGDAYLMVAEDGGVFNYSDKPFSGSLGSNPPANPIVSITALS